MTPGRGHFWPQGHTLNKFGRGPLGDATYQISRLGLMVSDQKIFPCFSLLSLCETCDPWGRAIFGPRGDILNKLGRGPLGDATY